MYHRAIPNTLLLSLACLLAVASGQFRGHERLHASDAFSAEAAENVVVSDGETDLVAVLDAALAEKLASFGRPLSPVILPEDFCTGPTLFLRGPPLS
ncbi:hypothetical protein [Bythopirellula goksoeyrii]|uniref:Uncharacterized protein n=1 Tax=Bythopirellula goksoeyrii TaxID=1400387 RepID=A0A5B9QH55_9BACT|nr:hypothetical protein [Bythopirellula goksoeyrii]QEG36900.1 hypothetical protein Pr1d_42390 [Bythopirellula goksoeyrii]